MLPMGKTEKDWNGFKLGFLKTVQPDSFSKLIRAACNFRNNSQETFVRLGPLILSFTCNFFAYFKFHSDWGRVTSKIKQNELDCRDTAPLSGVKWIQISVGTFGHLNPQVNPGVCVALLTLLTYPVSTSPALAKFKFSIMKRLKTALPCNSELQKHKDVNWHRWRYHSVSPLWRVHVSPFACKLLDCITVLPFFR